MKIYEDIKNYNKEVIILALGEIGLDFYHFVCDLNTEHFAINDLPINEELSDKLCQILFLVDFAYRNNLDMALKDINKFYSKYMPIELKNSDKRFTRLIKNNLKKEEIRKTKKISCVGLSSFYEKAKIIWDNLPNDFEMFARYNNNYEKLINEAQIKANRYLDLGCEELHDNILISINHMKELSNDLYFGFNRMSIRNASIILAKLNNFILTKKEFSSFEQNKYIITKKNNIYNPKIYPLYFLENIATERIKKIINDLENPSFFDHYIVLIASHKEADEHQDIENVQRNNTIPVLMGEKDGKCYFISYWI